MSTNGKRQPSPPAAPATPENIGSKSVKKLTSSGESDLFYRYPLQQSMVRGERRGTKLQTTTVVQLDLDEAERFLSRIWECYHPDALCYALVIIFEKGLWFKHFCTDKAECQKPERCAKKWLAQQKGLENAHVYFQVLPLAWKPEKGRGSEKDVLVGQWVFADLDFKEVVEKPAFEGCREGEDHALECYYQESGKWVHVKRPPLQQVLSSVREKLGVEPTLVVDSGAGYHLYFRVKDPLESKSLKLLLEKVVSTLGGDPQSKDLARILRLPGTVNPRVNRRVKVLLETQSELNHEDIKRVIWEERREEKREKKPPSFEREERKPPERGVKILWLLSYDKARQIAEALRVGYKAGKRQKLALWLSGFFAKRGVHPLSTMWIVKELHDSTNDEDPLKVRLSAVVYSYKKAGVDVDPFAEEIERLTGVKPYGLEREIPEEAVKGISGLEEILEEEVGRERALAILQEICEILKSASPWPGDSVIGILSERKKLYAVADLRERVMVRALRVGDKLVYDDYVATVAPTRVTIFRNPLGGVTKYEVVFERKSGRESFKIGPATVPEIEDRLIVEGVVTNKRLLHDVLSAIIQAWEESGRAEEKSEVESPGFFKVEEKIILVRCATKNVERERLREALELLNELAEEWFAKSQEKFATVIKWAALAPFNYILKTEGRWMKWLLLHGDAKTGKSTLGLIAVSLWDHFARQIEPSVARLFVGGSEADTPAKFMRVESSTTFPIVVDEAHGLLRKEELREEVINYAVIYTTVRGRFERGLYVTYPALAPMILTMNRVPPISDATMRRFIPILFTYSEKIPEERRSEFEKRVLPRLPLLGEIGNFIANLVLERGLPKKDDFEEAALSLLQAAYEHAGLPLPEWLKKSYEETEDVGRAIAEIFVDRLITLIGEEFTKRIHRLNVVMEDGRLETLSGEDISLTQRAVALLKAGLLPGVSLRNNNVIIRRELLERLGIHDYVNLKSLAEILGAEYRKFSERVESGVKSTSAVIIPLETFLKMLEEFE